MNTPPEPVRRFVLKDGKLVPTELPTEDVWNPDYVSVEPKPFITIKIDGCTFHYQPSDYPCD